MSLEPYYEDDWATIYHGDALEVLPTLPPRTVDAVVTDPPYKLSQEYGSGVDADNLLAVSCIYPAAADLLAVVSPGAVAAVFYDSRILPLALAAFRRGGWKYLRNLTLYRRAGNAYPLHGWMSTSDFVLLFTAPGSPPRFHANPAHDTYVKDRLEPVGFDHPAQKPEAFVRSIVENLTPPNGLVLDPFIGSGTTLSAAKGIGRRSIGIELEERYCEIAAKRLAQEVLDFGGAA